jgi:hypothetical protein
LKLEYGLNLRHYLHFAEGGCTLEVLDIQWTQTGGVEFSFEDDVLFAEVDRADAMTAH